MKAGTIAGFKKTCYGIKDGEAAITFDYTGVVYPEMDGMEQFQEIRFEGTPNYVVVFKDGPPGPTVVRILVNMIQHVVNAKPGLVTMKDLPIPRAFLGDARKAIETLRATT